MRRNARGIRAGTAAAVLAATAALLAAPTAHADPASGPGDGDRSSPVRLTQAALDRLSARYQPRTDGTPGQVASVSGASAQTPAPTAPVAGQLAAAKGATNGGADDAPAAGLTQTGQMETARGAASTVALGGTGDWVSIFGGGTVTRLDAQGDPVWNRTSHSLYTDWRVTPTSALSPQEYLPTMYEGYDPYQPSSTGRHPYASADFDHDGVADIAVAYNVGVYPLRPFSVPGSDLNEGTFVTVLDGRDGHTLYSKLLPGYVGSMLVQDGRLVVAERTGPDWDYAANAEQGASRSSLIALDFARAAGGRLTGRTAWTYSTRAPWASWSDLVPLSGGRVGAAWTDTPFGLGSPRPAAGHVLVLDAATGRVRTDVATPEFPRALVADPSDSGRVLVTEVNDPFDAVRWDLTAIEVGSGKRSVLASREGTLPEDFQVVQDTHGRVSGYAVAELGINADLTDGQSTVSRWDTRGRTQWSYTTASTVGGPNAPTVALAVDRASGRVLASVSDPVAWSSDEPNGPEHTQLVALDAGTGRTAWQRDGALSGDQFTPYRGKLLTVGYEDTAYTVDPRTGGAGVLPMLGDAFTAAAADVNHDGVRDLIVGGQSRGVFALDGRTLKNPVPRQLWHAVVGGPVHQVQFAATGRHGEQQIVVATSVGFAVLDPSTGSVRSDVDAGGGFVPGVTVGKDAHGDPQIVAAGDTLAAWTPDGRRTWSYVPSGAEGTPLVFSDVVPDGAGHLLFEYSGVRSAPSGPAAIAPTAVSLDASGRVQWTEQPKDPDAAWAVQRGGAYASPYIPGADGHGVAFVWGGDTPVKAAHLTQIVDARTGAVVTAHRTVGSNTMQELAASPAYGLIEMHNNLVTVYPPDGGAPRDERLGVQPWDGVFATAQDGSQSFATASFGLFQWSQPYPADPPNYVDAASSQFALFAGGISKVKLGNGKGKPDDVIGLALDWRALGISLQGGGYDEYQGDSYPHGITSYQLTSNTPAAEPGSAAGSAGTAAPADGPAVRQPAPDQFGSTADLTSAAPVAGPGLSLGIASNPLKVRATIPVTRPDSAAPGDTPVEVTKGYTPQQIQHRLGLTGDGAGQTVAIVDAFDYPNAESDLNHFAAHFGLPQTCDSVSVGSDCFDFRQLYADGSRPAANAGWNEEAALDIEWAHSVAPHARIVLVEAADASAAALYRGVDAAEGLHPSAISNSWGMSEFSGESFYDGHCKLADSVCVQSTGDDGYPAGYTSTSPYTLAIGGTNLKLDADGGTVSETAWSSTGGGASYFEKRPAYQDGVQSTAFRGTPDVSFVADPATGVAVYTTALTGKPVWLQVGGTSLSAPVWAGVLAAADQLRAQAGKPHLASAGPGGDTVHAAVYGLGDALADVTSGSNGGCGAQCTAGPGYDFVTGLGSPRAGVDAALAVKK